MLLLGAWAGWTINVLALFFLFVSLFLVLMVLIQKPRGGGLAGAFGGAGGGAQAAFGAKAGELATWITIVLFVVFIMLAMLLRWGVKPDEASGLGGGGSTSQGTTAPIAPPSSGNGKGTNGVEYLQMDQSVEEPITDKSQGNQTEDTDAGASDADAPGEPGAASEPETSP